MTISKDVIEYAKALKVVKNNGLDIKKIDSKLLNNNDDIGRYICLEAVKQNGMALKYIHNQDNQISIEAVRENGHALQFVKHQTETICSIAVNQNGTAIKHVKNQTLNICLEAVSNNPFAIYHIKNSSALTSEPILLATLKCYPNYIFEITNPNEKLLLKAISVLPKPISGRSPDFYLKMVMIDGLNLQYIEEKYQTDLICLEAVKQNGLALAFIKNKALITPEVCENALMQTYDAISFVPRELLS